MSSVPENLEHLSERLSEVLSEIGVNDEIIKKRQTCGLFQESVDAVFSVMKGTDSIWYYFGSQTEGSTTLGIYSDIDIVYCLNSLHVIHDWGDWKHGVTSVLMVQYDTTAVGYCLLQLLRDDAPLAASYVSDEHYYLDAKGRVLLKNTFIEVVHRQLDYERHGPAGYSPERDNVRECDFVLSLRCPRWPAEGRRWVNRRSRSGWPSAQLKSECETAGCFLVPVGSKISGMDDLEWRMSTASAERCLMFSINVTQMRCYILMKMLLKSYRVFHNVISSYMCKTVLFHCIENTNSVFWQERNLLLCLNQILRVLYNFVYYINCPHFIIPENNLMAERISAEQQRNLLAAIHHIIHTNGRVFYEIQIDDIGVRLQKKLNRIQFQPRRLLSAVEIRKKISFELCNRSANSILVDLRQYAEDNNNNNVQDAVRCFLRYYFNVKQQYPNLSCLEQKACSFIEPLVCSTIGSLLASYCTTINKQVSDIAMTWLKLGLNSDVSSGLLKLATVCYSVGDINVTESILRHVDQQYDSNILMPVCICHTDSIHILTQWYTDEADQIQITNFRHIVSYCVFFMRCEVNIVPQEMRQEYFRSTPEEEQCRDERDEWMDIASVDSLPYLYFLQYKTYGRLRNRGEQERALLKLQQVALDEPQLRHRETALNLLGQCMEQENLPIKAFHCYAISLQVRPGNNAATFHISRLHPL